MRQLSQIYLLLLLVTPLNGCTTIGYYGQAIGGHVSLMMKARPIHQVITAPETDPELRRQLERAWTGLCRQQHATPASGNGCW